MQTQSRIGRGEVHGLWAVFAVLALAIGTEWLAEAALARLYGRTSTAASLVSRLEELHTLLAEGAARERERAANDDGALLRVAAATRSQLGLLGTSEQGLPTREPEHQSTQLLALLDGVRTGVGANYAELRRGVHDELELQRTQLERDQGDRCSLSYAAQGGKSLGLVVCVGLLLFVCTRLRRETRLREASELALQESEQRLTTAWQLAEAALREEKQALCEQLVRANADLERSVEQRTQELRCANEELTRQIRERQEAQAALERSEQQLRQSQKLEALGSLAGGVAHDFNNLLSVILSYGELLQRELPPDSTMREEAEEITRAGMRAADLTRQLLAFSRQQLLAPKDVDLNAALEGMRRMLQHVLGEDIELRILTDPDLYMVRVDPGQLEQVILNLVMNARDAMPCGGTLTIETCNLAQNALPENQRPSARACPHVLLRVTDTGTGMDSTVQARIFEPFFTTKDKGKGTGLGLSTTHGIVQQSGGSVRVSSTLGLGTTFCVYLPRAMGGDIGAAAGQSAASGSVQGSETVLLVEDDEQVRSLAQSVLERSGFRVIAACGGEEALSVERSFAEPIQLLLTDVVMPRMSGRQLAERLCVGRPLMKVLFMSGYTDDKVMQHGVFDAGIQFLHKPLTSDGLARKVREVLDSRS